MENKLGSYINNLMTTIVDKEERLFNRSLAYNELISLGNNINEVLISYEEIGMIARPENKQDKNQTELKFGENNGKEVDVISPFEVFGVICLHEPDPPPDLDDPEKVRVLFLKSETTDPSLTADVSSLRTHVPFNKFAWMSSGSSTCRSGWSILLHEIRIKRNNKFLI